jgi:hypothetical protein
MTMTMLMRFQLARRLASWTCWNLRAVADRLEGSLNAELTETLHRAEATRGLADMEAFLADEAS